MKTKDKKTKYKKMEKGRETTPLRLIGVKGKIIKFKEIESLNTYMERKGWDLVFEKIGDEKDNGWKIEFRKRK